MNDAVNNAAQSATDEEAASRLEKDLIAVKNDIAHLSEQITDAVGALATVAQNRGRRGLRQARASVEEIISSASDRTGAVAGAARDAASSLADTLTDAIRERPVASVALAMGIGFIAGVAWRR